MIVSITRYVRVALLVVGSAILLYSCDEQTKQSDAAAEAALMTEYSENLSIVMSQNGQRSYFFETPLVEGYTLGNEPYREFRRGIKITTYQDDSLSRVDAVLTANYAIYYEKRELWEAKGDVEVHKFDGTEVYTQQLFWNARTKKIYSNVDTKLVKGNNEFVGERFESDEDFKDWRFYYQKSRMEVNVAPAETQDSTRRADTEIPVSEADESRKQERVAAPMRVAPQSRKEPATAKKTRRMQRKEMQPLKPSREKSELVEYTPENKPTTLVTDEPITLE